MIELNVRRSGQWVKITADAVSFDFYDTLVHLDSAQPPMHQTLSDLGFFCTKDLEMQYNSESRNGKLTPSGADYDIWRLGRIMDLCVAVGVPSRQVGSLARKLINIDQNWTVKAAPGALRLVSELAGAGVPHVIVSNWDYRLEPYLEQAGLPLTLRSVTSRDAGARKPSARIFEIAAELLGCAARIVHVGDRFDSDVKGAQAAGWTPCWLTDSEQHAEVARVMQLDELHDYTSSDS